MACELSSWSGLAWGDVKWQESGTELFMVVYYSWLVCARILSFQSLLGVGLFAKCDEEESRAEEGSPRKRNSWGGVIPTRRNIPKCPCETEPPWSSKTPLGQSPMAPFGSRTVEPVSLAPLVCTTELTATEKSADSWTWSRRTSLKNLADFPCQVPDVVWTLRIWKLLATVFRDSKCL